MSKETCSMFRTTLPHTPSEPHGPNPQAMISFVTKSKRLLNHPIQIPHTATPHSQPLRHPLLPGRGIAAERAVTVVDESIHMCNVSVTPARNSHKSKNRQFSHCRILWWE